MPNVTAAVTRLTQPAMEVKEVLVRNTGAQSFTVSKDPAVASLAGVVVAASAEHEFSLAPGESLYAICAVGQSSVAQVV